MVTRARQYLPHSLGKNFRVPAGTAGQYATGMVYAAGEILPRHVGLMVNACARRTGTLLAYRPTGKNSQEHNAPASNQNGEP